MKLPPSKFPTLFQKIPLALPRLSNSSPFSRLFRQLEQEMETVVKVLQPGHLGIVEHKFSAEEIREAKTTVDKAVKNWRQNAILEKKVILKAHIHICQSYGKDTSLVNPTVPMPRCASPITEELDSQFYLVCLSSLVQSVKREG